jgi:hypothetical protein
MSFVVVMRLHTGRGRVTIFSPMREGGSVSATDREGTFWFCLDHHAVEPFAGCGSRNRIGPFDTEGDAARALQTIAERERRYDAEDSAWDGDA